MAAFEQALSTLENSVVEAAKSADLLSKALRRLLSAVRSGNVQQIEKSLSMLPSLGDEAQAAATDLATRWQFDTRAHLEGGYLAELLDEAAQAGLTLFERDGRIFAFPLMLRLLPADTAIRIAQTTARDIRPKEVVRKLKVLQDRPQRLNEQRFLELIHRAYQRLAAGDWRRIERGSGPAVLLSEIHEVLTLLPGSEYAIEEFGRDLLLLDRQPMLRTRDGSGFRFTGSTLGRTAKKIVIYDEAGNTREFVAIAFVKES
jgi:hypothetical protein